jgi:hypothetical protein
MALGGLSLGALLRVQLLMTLIVSVVFSPGIAEARSGTAKMPKVHASAVTPPSSALQLARAVEGIGIPGFIDGAEFVTGPSSGDAVGVSDAAGAYLPTDGTTFGMLTTGSVFKSPAPNDSGDTGQDNGSSYRGVNDVTTLRVHFNVPAGYSCVGFDLAFYSEEFPEYVGSTFNDAFIAEIDANDWSYDPDSNTVDAPRNFAFDTNGKQLSVNTALVASQETGLEYDGSTVLLRARQPITPGPHAIYFTIFDAGDHVYDSAAFIDNLRPLKVPASACKSGVKAVDSDGDALSDEWETIGADTDGDGDIDLDLAAMGANPNRKDLFVELDYMKKHKLDPLQLQAVVDAFKQAPVSNRDGTTGIRLHLDAGPSFVMNPDTGAKWGARSRSNELPHDNELGDCPADNCDLYDWTEFVSLKSKNLDATRWPVFRYAMSAHKIGKSSAFGLARGAPSSDMVMGLSETRWLFWDSTIGGRLQATTLMHELGHLLGLKHGGDEHANGKLNYLSIMNYLYAFDGLPRANGGQALDYSRFGRPGGASSNKLADLPESALDEAAGFGGSGPLVNSYRAANPCGDGTVALTGAVNFDCDKTIEPSVEADILPGFDNYTLHSFDDWTALNFRGGTVGGLKVGSTLPAIAPVTDDATVADLRQHAKRLSGDRRRPKIRVRGARKVRAPKRVKLRITAKDAGGMQTLVVRVGKRTRVVQTRRKAKRRLTATVKIRRGRKTVRIAAFDKLGNMRKATMRVRVAKR